MRNIVEFFWNSPIKYRWEIECNSHVLAFEGHFTKPCVRLWSSISYVIYVVMSMVSRLLEQTYISIKSIRLRREPKAGKIYRSVSISLRASQVQHPFLLIQHSHHNIAMLIPPKLGGGGKFSRIGSLLVFVKTNIHLINTERLQFSDMYTSVRFWVCYFFCSEIIFFIIYNYPKFTNMLFFLTSPSDDPYFPVPWIYFSWVHLNKLLFLFTHLSLLISYNTFELQFMVDGFAFLA